MRAFGCVGAFAVCAALLAPSATHAATTNLDLSTAVVTGGAGFIAHEGRLRFDANTPGQTATFAFSSVPGERYSISVIGQNNQSTSFFQFLIDADGAGAGGFKQLGSNFNFGSGFNTVTLPTLADLGTLDFLQIVNGGTANNSAGQISGISIVSTSPVPLPAALPLFATILAGGGLIAWRRKRKAAAAMVATQTGE